MVNARDFARLHDGETVWVIGSGRTLDYIAPAFFDDKTVIGVNQSVWEVGIHADYYVTMHHRTAEFLAEENPISVVVTTDFEKVPPEHRRPADLSARNIVQVLTTAQHYGAFDARVHWSDVPSILTIGPSSATLGLSWAEYLGAKHIVLAGLDCGQIDGKANSTSHVPMGGAGDDPTHQHYRLWESALVSSAEVLRGRGVHVHSLNPWVTLNREGHTFTQ